jgi:hypothetical protein
MAMEVLIGDRFGRVIAEVQPEVGPLSWRLNLVGKTTLTFSRSDDKAIEENLRYGNRVLVRFDEGLGLPVWGGTIEPPREWTRREITVTCRSIEWTLQYRQTKKTRSFWSTPVGSIFYQVLQEMEEREPIGLQFGRIWTGGGQHSPRYHFKSIWWILTQSLRSMEQCDFRFVPQLADGKITFLAEMYERLGEDKSGRFHFKEGMNTHPVRYTEQGPIVNEFTAIGSGATWGKERPTRSAVVDESRRLYGLRQDSKIFSGVVESTTLDRHASTHVELHAAGNSRLKLRAVNKAPATFAQYNVGDSLRCVLPSIKFSGYDERVRILSRQYSESSGDCELVVEEESDWRAKFAGTGAETTQEEL